MIPPTDPQPSQMTETERLPEPIVAAIRAFGEAIAGSLTELEYETMPVAEAEAALHAIIRSYLGEEAFQGERVYFNGFLPARLVESLITYKVSP